MYRTKITTHNCRPKLCVLTDDCFGVSLATSRLERSVDELTDHVGFAVQFCPLHVQKVDGVTPL